MMAFTGEQERWLRGIAERVLFDQRLLFAGDSEEKRHIQLVEDQLKVAYEAGYYNALTEVRSTPWEWRTLFVPAGAHRNEACEQAMNAYSEAGWELYMVTIDRQFWRRRRAVRELEAKSI